MSDCNHTPYDRDLDGGCVVCLRRELAEARGLLAKCRGEIEYQDGLLSQLCPVEGPMAKSPHPALAEIDAALTADQPPEMHPSAVKDGCCLLCGRPATTVKSSGV